MNRFPYYPYKHYDMSDMYCVPPRDIDILFKRADYVKRIKNNTLKPRINLIKYIIKNFDDLWKKTYMMLYQNI